LLRAAVLAQAVASVDTPVDDEAVIRAYEEWKLLNVSPWIRHINEQAERTLAMAVADSQGDSAVTLPGPQWSIALSHYDQT
jgi:hypothetical protein